MSVVDTVLYKMNIVNLKNRQNQLSPDLIMCSKKLYTVRNQLNHKLNYIQLIFFTFNCDWFLMA